MKECDGILFDLDGTLWDSSQEVADSWLLALQDCPEEAAGINRESIQGVMGKTMEDIARILFSDLSPKRQKELLDHCVQVENEYILEHGGHLLEGLVETLKILQKKYSLFIVSNCQVGYIEAFLKHHKLESYFTDFLSYGETGRPKGENIQLMVQRHKLKRAVYLGDTQGDYDAASYAGIPFIHARTGYGTVDVQVPYITRLAQMPELIESVMGPVEGR